MSDIIELWSLPWHDLLRNVAETFRAEANENVVGKQKPLISRNPSARAGNWLARTRNGAAGALPGG
jgi:hypothetical protein